jgi:hypothetical protein
MRVENRGATQPFDTRGAILILTRFVYPTEFVVLGQVLRFVGWAGLVFGIVLGAVSEVLSSSPERILSVW